MDRQGCTSESQDVSLLTNETASCPPKLKHSQKKRKFVQRDTCSSENNRKLPHPTLQRHPYENFILTDPNDQFLAYIPKKRFHWYQRKNLAELVTEDTIRLNFQPKKKSVDEFQREKLENLCVVCGAEQHLTRHHIVPYEYRKNLLISYKSKNSHDIVAICTNCHAKYETVAFHKKKALSDKLGIPLQGEGKEINKNKVKIKKLSSALIKARTKMPESRRQEVEQQLNSLVDESIYLEDGITLNEDCLLKLSTIEVTEIADTGFTTHGELVVREMLKDFSDSEEKQKEIIHQFIVSWRKHFLEHTNPRYMSEYWDVERPIGDAER